MTQQAIADELGVSRQTISNWLKIIKTKLDKSLTLNLAK